jgi:hypothetical protein
VVDYWGVSDALGIFQQLAFPPLARADFYRRIPRLLIARIPSLSARCHRGGVFDNASQEAQPATMTVTCAIVGFGVFTGGSPTSR